MVISVAIRAAAAANQPREADRAVRPQKFAEDDGGDGSPQSDRGHVERHLQQRLPAEDGEGERDGAHGAQDKDVGGQEDQSDEERYLLQHEEVGVAAVVQRDGRPDGGSPQQADDGEHRRLREEQAQRAGAVERALEAEQQGEQTKGDGEGVDGGGDEPVRTLGTPCFAADFGRGRDHHRTDGIVFESLRHIHGVHRLRTHVNGVGAIREHVSDIGGMCSQLEIARVGVPWCRVRHGSVRWSPRFDRTGVGWGRGPNHAGILRGLSGRCAETPGPIRLMWRRLAGSRGAVGPGRLRRRTAARRPGPTEVAAPRLRPGFPPPGRRPAQRPRRGPATHRRPVPSGRRESASGAERWQRRIRRRRQSRRGQRPGRPAPSPGPTAMIR